MCSGINTLGLRLKDCSSSSSAWECVLVQSPIVMLCQILHRILHTFIFTLVRGSDALHHFPHFSPAGRQLPMVLAKKNAFNINFVKSTNAQHQSCVCTYAWYSNALEEVMEYVHENSLNALKTNYCLAQSTF